jgi:multiple sugar transport system permease protein
MRRPWLWFLVIAAVTFSAGPFVLQILASLRPESEITQIGIPSSISLESYVGAFRGRPFGRVILNSAVVAGATTALCLAVGAAAAFALAKLDMRGKRLVLGGILAASMFPPIATLSPLYLVIRALGLYDRLGGLILPYTSFALPLTIWVLYGFFRDIPDEIYRAARVDGCSPFRAFREVLLPLAAPGLGATAILVFISAYNELIYALTFTSSPEQRTVPVAISLFAGEHKDPWGEIAAASVITTLPLILVTLLFQRRIIAGLTSGAVKG